MIRISIEISAPCECEDTLFSHDHTIAVHYEEPLF